MALDMISITEIYWQSRDRIIRKYCIIFIRISHLTVWNDSMKSEDPFYT